MIYHVRVDPHDSQAGTRLAAALRGVGLATFEGVTDRASLLRLAGQVMHVWLTLERIPSGPMSPAFTTGTPPITYAEELNVVPDGPGCTSQHSPSCRICQSSGTGPISVSTTPTFRGSGREPGRLFWPRRPAGAGCCAMREACARSADRSRLADADSDRYWAEGRSCAPGSPSPSLWWRRSLPSRSEGRPSCSSILDTRRGLLGSQALSTLGG